MWMVENDYDHNIRIRVEKKAAMYLDTDISKKSTDDGLYTLLGVVWDDCPEKGCNNKVCLALNSDKCFPHTKGNKQWKLLKIWWRNLFR